jgi:hypothetical protein
MGCEIYYFAGKNILMVRLRAFENKVLIIYGPKISRRLEAKRLLGRPRHGWKTDIKMDLKKIEGQGVD